MYLGKRLYFLVLIFCTVHASNLSMAITAGLSMAHDKIIDIFLTRSVDWFELVSTNTYNARFPEFSSLTKNDALRDIITKREIRVGVLSKDTTIAAVKPLLSLIVKQIASYYINRNAEIAIKYNEYPSSSILIDSLILGDIDITLPALHASGFSPFVDRTFEITPLPLFLGYPINFWRKFPEKFIDPYQNIDSFVKEAIETGRKIAVYETDHRRILTTVFPELITEKTTTLFTEILDNNEFIGMFNPSAFLTTPYSKVRGKIVYPLTWYTAADNSFIRIPDDDFEEIYTGNAYLKTLFDVIVSGLQIVNTHMTFSEDEYTYAVGDCLSNIPSFPLLRTTGVLGEIMKRHVMYVGTVVGDFAPFYTAKSAGRGVKVSGVAADVEQMVFNSFKQLMADNVYNLKVEYIVYNSNSELFEALDRGEVDATSITTLLPYDPYKDIGSNFLTTCTAIGKPVFIFASAHYSSFMEIIDVIYNYSFSCKVLTERYDDIPLARSIFGSNCECAVENNAANAAEMLIFEKAIAYLPNPLSTIVSIQTVIFTSLSLIDTGKVLTTSMYFRKDRIPYDNSSWFALNGFSLFVVIISCLIIILAIIFVIHVVYQRRMVLHLSSSMIGAVERERLGFAHYNQEDTYEDVLDMY